MGDTDALRDKIAQAIHAQRCLSPEDCIGGVNDDYRLADAVLPVVTQEVEALRKELTDAIAEQVKENDELRDGIGKRAISLALLRSRVEALADELDEAVQTIPTFDAASLGRRGGLRDAARLVRSLLPQEGTQQ